VWASVHNSQGLKSISSFKIIDKYTKEDGLSYVGVSNWAPLGCDRRAHCLSARSVRV
jgi:hypothetical protein